MIACISKNDRAGLLFAELANVRSDIVDLGSIQPSRLIKLLGALSSASFHLGQMRSDMLFSPVVSGALERKAAARLAGCASLKHVVQWGATSFPTPASAVSHGYSVVTDGPYDPDDPEYPLEWRPVRWHTEFFERQREILRGARFIFTLSEWARSKVIKVHSIDPTNVIRIGWGPMFQVGPVAAPKPQPPCFVSIGNEWHRKGMDIVVEATRQLLPRFPALKTIIAGKPRGLALSSGPGVHLIPHAISQTEVISLISSARAVIVASRFDASPHIIMESLQLGTPVIGTAIGGIPEAIRPPAGGRIIPVSDPSALASAMEDILLGDAETQRLEVLGEVAQADNWRHAAEILSAALDRL